MGGQKAVGRQHDWKHGLHLAFRIALSPQAPDRTPSPLCHVQGLVEHLDTMVGLSLTDPRRPARIRAFDEVGDVCSERDRDGSSGPTQPLPVQHGGRVRQPRRDPRCYTQTTLPGPFYRPDAPARSDGEDYLSWTGRGVALASMRRGPILTVILVEARAVRGLAMRMHLGCTEISGPRTCNRNST